MDLDFSEQLPDKICEYCGKQYQGRGKKYCSRKCLYESYRTGKTINCVQCGKEFYVPKSRIAENVQFCSLACKGLASRNRVLLQCAQCGKSFEVKESQIKRGKKFCSFSCAVLGRKGLPEEKKKRIRQVCDWCSEIFLISPTRLKWNRGQFCSTDCRYASQIGEGNPAWNGGSSYEPYSPDFNDDFKQRIRNRDANKCIVCKLPGRSVHHIDYDKNNTKDNNCVTLCSACHGATNHNREYWEAALSDLLKKRQNYDMIPVVLIAVAG